MGMNELGSTQVIDEAAARWVARIDSRPLDGQSRLELEQWLARDNRHRGALFRALAVWSALGDDNAISEDIWEKIGTPAQSPDAPSDEIVHSSTAVAPSPNPRFPRRRLLWTGGAIAAALIPVAFVPGLWKPKGGEHSRRIKTGLGEIARVPLRDGSLVMVNTTSALDVAQSAHLRSVRLEKGEAWFQVAKDASRPFVVSAGDIRVRAVGTAFSVRLRNGGADVQVTEGTVEVWIKGQRERRTAISAGTRIFATAQAGPEAPTQDPADIERNLSWREGALKFQGSTIQEAVTEFNRYNATKLEVDPALANEKIVGRFSAKEPDAFAKMVSLAFGARIEKEGKRIRIAKN